MLNNTQDSEPPWQVGLVTTWFELTGQHVSIDCLLRELGNHRKSDVVEWAGTFLHIVSEMFGQSPLVQRELIDLCLADDVIASASEILARPGRNVIFHRRQLWLLLQFACVVCNESESRFKSLKDSFGRLCLVASDTLRSIHIVQVTTNVVDKAKLEWQMALLISIAEILPNGNGLSRARSLWFDSVASPMVAKELKRCGMDESLDAVLLRHVGISLTDTFFALVTIYIFLTSRTKARPIIPIVMTTAGEWWGNVPTQDRLQIFKLLSVPIEEFAAHLFGTPRQSWATDFSPVMARPFIESRPGHFVCPDVNYLRTFFLDGIFWLIDKALPDKEWGNAFGAMYEWYIKQLLLAATQRRAETHSMFFDKVIFNGTNDQVCDALILSTTTVALFESKGTRLTTRQKSGVSVEETSTAITKSVGSSKSGIGQLAKSIARILSGDVVIAGDTLINIDVQHTVLPILVWYEESASNVPTRIFLENAFVARLISEGSDPSRVGPLLLFSTSELELFEQCCLYETPDLLLRQFADFVRLHPCDPHSTFLRYAFLIFEGRQIDKGYVGQTLDRIFDDIEAEHVRRANANADEA